MLATQSKTLVAVIAALGLAAARHADASPPLVHVASGVLQGQRADGIVVFEGVPYAAAPVGPLRWRPPVPAPAWSDVRDAAGFGPACPQPVSADGAPNLGLYAGPTSEDCLTLNVWAPPGARRAPVMVWIHGGGHRFGAASMGLFDGAAFARDGVVLVSEGWAK